MAKLHPNAWSRGVGHGTEKDSIAGREAGQSLGRERLGKALALHRRGHGADRDTQLRVVTTGMSSGRLRTQALHRRERKTGQGGGRREPSRHPGAPVRALHRPEGLRVQQFPHPASHETRPLPARKRGCLGGDHVGRGPGPDRGALHRDYRQIRQGKLRQLWRHRTRGRRVVHDLHRDGVADAQCLLHAVGLRVLLPAAGRRNHVGWARISRDGLRRLSARTL